MPGRCWDTYPMGGEHEVPLRKIADSISKSYATAQHALKEIREAGYPVCSSNRGVYLARNVAEMEEYVRMTSARVQELCNTLAAARAALKYMKGE